MLLGETSVQLKHRVFHWAVALSSNQEMLHSHGHASSARPPRTEPGLEPASTTKYCMYECINVWMHYALTTQKGVKRIMQVELTILQCNSDI